MSTITMQRWLTRAFIASDPTVISLIPTEETVLPNGGKSRVDGIPRIPQKFVVIPMTFDQRPTVTAGGVERVISYTLLGLWDAEMELWDHWVGDDGSTYTIVAFADGHGYEKKGLVERHLPVS